MYNTTPTAATQNLLRLAVIRCIVLTGQWSVFFYSYYYLQLSLNLIVAITLTSFTALTLLSFWRLRFRWPITDAEFFLHLFIDISSLTILLYYSGGATNPFISYYLVPICISAIVLPWVYTWAITLGCILLYSAMLYYYIPISTLESHNSHIDHTFWNFHFLGMWVNFAASGILITYFVVKMATTLREQEQKLMQNRENERRNEQLLAVATLAACTAHELGTPLSTMTILVNEMANEQDSNSSLSKDLNLLKHQLLACKDILQKLTETAERHQTDKYEKKSADQYIKKLISHWQIMRPITKIELQLINNNNIPIIHVTPILDQAIINLLNNAADASDKTIYVEINWNLEKLFIKIIDQGSGINPEIIEKIGKPFIKSKGLGLGLFLTHTTIERLGGTVKIYNQQKGGTCAEIQLPLI